MTSLRCPAPWVHEIKHDLIVRRDGAAVRPFTRRGYDSGPTATQQSPTLRPS
jgi:hypothetical protein